MKTKEDFIEMCQMVGLEEPIEVPSDKVIEAIIGYEDATNNLVFNYFKVKDLDDKFLEDHEYFKVQRVVQMDSIEDLEEFIEANDFISSRYLSEEETISAIIGYDVDSNALVYDYDKLCEQFGEHFKKYSEEKKSDEEWYQEGAEWVDYNTIRSLPYKVEGYVNPIIIHNTDFLCQ